MIKIPHDGMGYNNFENCCSILLVFSEFSVLNPNLEIYIKMSRLLLDVMIHVKIRQERKLQQRKQNPVAVVVLQQIQQQH